MHGYVLSIAICKITFQIMQTLHPIRNQYIKLHFLLVMSSLFSVLPVIEYLAISCKNTDEKEDMANWAESECMKGLATRSVIS